MTTLSNTSSAELCAGTPTLQVLDNRGLMVRALQFNRNASGEVAARRVTQQRYGVRGELLSSIDPRLFDEQQLDSRVVPNFRYQSSLSGQVLRTLSQDAGEEVSLFDIEQGVCWRTNGRAQTWLSYDVLHRLSSTVEQTGIAPPRISERYVYGESRPDAALANSRGQVLRHYDTAGLVETSRFNTSAQPLQQVRQLLQDSLAESDWQGSEAQWPTHLAPERYLSRLVYDALGRGLLSIDAKGNVQRQQCDVAGQLASTDLRLAGEAQERSILSAISYSAAGQVLREVAGNGVVTDYTYEPQTQRLSRLRATRPAQSGRDSLLQDLTYTYDPVGNILSISNAALPTRYHQNQRIEPVNHYQYDALYQLRCASGRENASAGQQGPSLPVPDTPISADPNQYSNYTRRYTYDRGGNLTQIQHQGRIGYTLDTVISASSNHGVRQTGHLLPDEVEGFFDACGNLQQLAPGQPLLWDGRNQLQQVTQVVRSGPDNDLEHYQYDGGGARLRKTTFTQTSGTQRSAEVIYLPGLELRRTQRHSAGGSALEEELHVISAEGAGRQQVRFLHWEAGRPSSMPNDQLRGSLGNQIGSSVLELDQEANVLTLEEYFPYGGTAVWSGKTASETQYKFVRYSGKERDASGLYYYGFRYYAPWLGRWINPDPAGTVDGLNLYRMVRNNPVIYIDADGLQPIPQVAHFAWEGADISTGALSNMLFVKHVNPDYEVNVWTSRPMSIYSTLEKMLSSEDAPYERYLAHNFGNQITVNDTKNLYTRLAQNHPRGYRLESMYNREKSGAHHNYAAASDITRAALMFEEGGVYMDADVVVAGGLDTLTDMINSPSHDGFLYPENRVGTSNAVLASSRHSAKSAEFVDVLINHTERFDKLKPQASWTTKRSLVHDEALVGRLKGTVMTTGPGAVVALGLSGNKANILPEDMFFYRQSSPTNANAIESEQTLSDVALRGVRRGLDGRGAWSGVRAGRRDSVH